MERTETHDAIMKSIKDYQEATGSKCGLPHVQLIKNIGLSTKEAAPFLRELYDNKEFHVRQGLNDKLYFYGSKEKR